jgi:hypothetical protein
MPLSGHPPRTGRRSNSEPIARLRGTGEPARGGAVESNDPARRRRTGSGFDRLAKRDYERSTWRTAHHESSHSNVSASLMLSQSGLTSAPAFDVCSPRAQLRASIDVLSNVNSDSTRRDRAGVTGNAHEKAARKFSRAAFEVMRPWRLDQPLRTIGGATSTSGSPRFQRKPSITSCELMLLNENGGAFTTVTPSKELVRPVVAEPRLT